MVEDIRCDVRKRQRNNIRKIKNYDANIGGLAKHNENMSRGF